MCDQGFLVIARFKPLAHCRNVTSLSLVCIGNIKNMFILSTQMVWLLHFQKQFT